MDTDRIDVVGRVIGEALNQFLDDDAERCSALTLAFATVVARNMDISESLIEGMAVTTRMALESK